MKNTFIFSAALILCTTLWPQEPQCISQQAVKKTEQKSSIVNSHNFKDYNQMPVETLLNPDSNLKPAIGEQEARKPESIIGILNQGREFLDWTGDTQYIDYANNEKNTLSIPAVDLNLTANIAEEPEIIYGEGVTDIDGNFYPSVIIGFQEWMSENLKTTKYSNGNPIDYPGDDLSAWDNNTTGAYSWYFNNIAWKESYGALYNWYATNNPNGLCPVGWRVPSSTEWIQMIDYVVAQGYPNEGGYDYIGNIDGAGNAVKSC